MRKLAIMTVLVALAASACWPFDTDTADSDEPTPSTTPVVSGPAFVEDVEFIFMESYPVQVRAIVTGNLPTPCHEVVWSLDGTDLEISSAVDPGAVCAEVLEPFEVTIDVGSFESGDYTLTVNGEAYPFTI